MRWDVFYGDYCIANHAGGLKSFLLKDKEKDPTLYYYFANRNSTLWMYRFDRLRDYSANITIREDYHGA